VHGGAGRVPEAEANPDWSREAHAGLRAAVDAGRSVLEAGGPAIEAVVEVVAVLEACAAFNAGLGSVVGSDGRVEMDASLMRGVDRRAGAVLGLRRTAHPVRAARAALEDGRHVMYAGEGAEALARAAGLAEIDPAALSAAAPRARRGNGTVGAVARDAGGHLAAATSTGGTPGRAPGRVSDSALVGVATWADDESCAISTTGHGESFMRCVFAHAVDARVRAGAPLVEACEAMIGRVAALGGEGGCVAVDRAGRIALPFDTPAMPRAVARAGEPVRLAVHAGDALSADQLA
jgi:beta-aspartyl-peptidase (threonine type)